MAINKKSLFVLVSIVLTLAITFATVLSVAALTNDEATYGTDMNTPTTSNINTDNILDKASLQLSDDDEVIRTDNNGLISITILKAFQLPIEHDGKTTSVTMASGSVADALDKAGITVANDEKVSPSLTTEVDKNTKIVINKTVNITVTVSGETDSYEVPKGTVKEALQSLDIGYKKADKLNVKANAKVYDGMEVNVTKVTVKNVKKTKTIDFDTKVTKDSSMKKGTSVITQYGVEGKKVVTKKCTYEDGVLVSSKVVSTKVTKKPVPQKKTIGTKVTKKKTTKKTNSYTSGGSNNGGNTFVDNNGNTVSYKKIITGSGTAYTAPAGSGTATGKLAQVGGVAVNPSIIPYGSKLYIKASDGSYVYGYATAVDTGGALMDGSAIVDLFMDSYADCAAFGRRNVTIYVL